MAVGNDELSQFTFDPPAYQRVCGEIVDGGLDCRDGIYCSLSVFVMQELEGALDVI
jgi:hypothetical protein